jgi:hypothetical protein
MAVSLPQDGQDGGIRKVIFLHTAALGCHAVVDGKLAATQESLFFSAIVVFIGAGGVA